MKLNTLRPGPGARKRPKRLGRGDASGHGGTSTKGHKGQKARSGGYHKRAFEGGQTPIIRRLPKRGFRNVFRKAVAVVNVDQFGAWPASVPVTIESLREHGLVRSSDTAVKVLGRGDLQQAITVVGALVSASARQKIERAGGRIEESKP
ncbi:MAG: 50S ribosomal protein L15 [Deltaproteobacteria bacterium]|nr:50S ribosomal protein L15 [Deltaproteobacteria bacterium]